MQPLRLPTMPGTGRTRGRRAPGEERGQAFTETLMLTWILVVFFAALYQLFLMNETVYRSLTAVHQELFIGAYASNCPDPALNCTYDGGDLRSKVIWRSPDIPEVHYPVTDFFARYGLVGGRLTSNSPLHGDDIKRTKLGAGTYMPPFAALSWAFGQAVDPAVWIPFFENMASAMGNPIP